MSEGTEIMRRANAVARNVSALGGDNEALNTAVRVAQSLASSTLVPPAYQGNVANVMVALEYANRLQCSVLAVIQNLDVIHGRPSLRATFLIGTVNASGRFTPIRFRWQGTEGTDEWGCRAWAQDRASGEECPGPLITIGLAKKEGWFHKKDSKWQTIPELMLMYRAGAWWTRVYSPELSLGLHTSEEVEDFAAPVRVQSVAVDELNAQLRQISPPEDVNYRAQLEALIGVFAGPDAPRLSKPQNQRIIDAAEACEDDDASDDLLRSYIDELRGLAVEQASLA